MTNIIVNPTYAEQDRTHLTNEGHNDRQALLKCSRNYVPGPVCLWKLHFTLPHHPRPCCVFEKKSGRFVNGNHRFNHIFSARNFCNVREIRSKKCMNELGSSVHVLV